MQAKYLFVLLAATVSSQALALEAKLADTAWDGVTVPKGQQCQKFDGQNPTTPELMVSDIPEGTTKLLIEYSDRDSEKMNNGGHGRMTYTFEPSDTVTVPSIPGHSYDLPASFAIVEEHRSPGWDKAGAYMPPCSGAKGHAYYVTIKALAGDEEKAMTVVEMGKF
jgi:phosphatidylethanolamine-binding protein (PEBP) family uncharacterized protein